MAEASLTLPVERKYCASAITNSCAGTSFTVRGAFGMLLAIRVCRRRRRKGAAHRVDVAFCLIHSAQIAD